MTLVREIKRFNSQFDYGEYHQDPSFWIEMLAHQADEAREAYEDGNLIHAHEEAADAVLVAFQFIDSTGPGRPEEFVRRRIANAVDVGIQEEIVPKYKEWYSENHE